MRIDEQAMYLSKYVKMDDILCNKVNFSNVEG